MKISQLVLLRTCFDVMPIEGYFILFKRISRTTIHVSPYVSR